MPLLASDVITVVVMLLCNVALASAGEALRGSRLLQNETGTGPEQEPVDLPFAFYFSMPFVSAFVGWWTNKVALQLTFYPLKFWGWEVMRFKNQPVGLFGWQGIVPTKAEKMASDSVDLMTEKLFNVKEIFGRIDKFEAARHLKQGFNETLEKMITKISNTYILDESTTWKRTEAAIKRQITQWALDELPAFTAGFMGELVEKLDDVYDLKDMCVTEMVENPGLLVNVFTKVGRSELKFIERCGGYLGFVFGSVQTILFKFAIPSPESDYSLPFLGFLVGFLTNYIALYMIFSPVEEKKVCCGRVALQGLFLKRQQQASAMFASQMVSTVLNSKNIWRHMMRGPKRDKFEELLRKHADDFTSRMIGYARPLVITYMGAENLGKMRGDIQTMTVEEIENIVQYMHDYTNEALDLEVEITQKMQALPSKDFEQVLHPVFQEDEIKLILVGAFLGICVGSAQMAISLALQGI
mmetsp:Transcript_468/g.649  ORF Transcript_468/g.649 Transcript_468/m.649 type:complete len:469 (-) Transcript_468:162-1568(-)